MENHEIFRFLLTRHDITQALAAKAITEVTHRPLAPRTVRSWLTDPANPSFRPCPSWAIDALNKYLSRPNRQSGRGGSRAYSSSKNTGSTAATTGKADFPYSFEQLEKAFVSTMMPPEKTKQKSYEHIRYKCRRCKMQVWGAANLTIVCGECECVLDQMKR